MKTTQFIRILILVVGFSFSATSLAQEGKIQGTVTDSKGLVLAGSSIVIVENNKSSSTDANGGFTIDNVANGSYQIVVSYIGFVTRKVTVKVPQTSKLSIALQDDQASLDEVVVTGVFDKRTALNSSIAITSISAVQIGKLVPNSAADLLKNVPGVYVNTSLGEIRNSVYSRGVTTGNNDGRWGYDYVSMQEDGLPVLNIPFGNFGPDFFLRADATLSKLEAVRGGSASIAGANAPGGIFNYISKTGGDKFGGEVRTRFGLEGNGKNPYYRVDLNLGGALAKNLTYNIGGFYRKSDGAQYPGYATNFGGQIKGNLLYKYNTGSLKLLVKVLDDHNLTAEGIPTLNYTDLKPAPGFSNTSSVLGPVMNITTFVPTRGDVAYKSSDLWHSKDKAFGLNWEQNLGESGWKFSNNARYSIKSSEDFTPLSVISPVAMDNIVTYFVIGALHPPSQIIPGTYNITQGGQSIMTVKSFSGFDYTVTSNTAPGSDVAANSLFFTPLIYQNFRANELLDQFNFTKKIKNMSFNIGGFIGISNFQGVNGSMGTSLNTIQNHPQPVNISITDPNGTIYQLTNPQGLVNVGADQGYVLYDNKQTQKAFYVAHTWEINNKLTLDWGARYEHIRVNGTNNSRSLVSAGTGGLDGNPLTLYDNLKSAVGNPFSYDKTLSYLSYSGALNYKISDNTAIYGRYSNGKKAPGLQLYLEVTDAFSSASLDPQIQTIQQFELGYKTKIDNFSATITPFYSLLSHLPTNVTFSDTNGALYNPPAFFNSIKTYGIELEGKYKASDNFNIQGVFTFQDSQATKYQSWIHLPDGNASGGDAILNQSGNETANVPKVMMNITPEYTYKSFYTNVTWSYMGDRQANFSNAFILPAFSQFNLAMGFDITKRLRLSTNVNNVLNTYGVMGWVGPGSFPNNLNLEGLTKQDVAANPNAFHQAIAIPARAYFLSLSYKF